MRLGLAWFVVITVEAAAMAAPPDGPGEAFFEQKVRPILVASCTKCHGAKKQESGLRLDARSALIGGDNGPAVVPGDPAKSLLIQAVNHEDDLAMPPGRKLSDEQIGVLKQWVERGAPWPGGDTPVTRPLGSDHGRGPPVLVVPAGGRPGRSGHCRRAGLARGSTHLSSPGSKQRVSHRHPRPTAGR